MKWNKYQRSCLGQRQNARDKYTKINLLCAGLGKSNFVYRNVIRIFVCFALMINLFPAGNWFEYTKYLYATDYNVGTLNVTTFDQPATFNGNPVQLTTADTLILSGGTLTITGNDSAYTALLGTGTGASTGFTWGTGGTINLNSGVTLTIDQVASTLVPLTQDGQGTLNLTGTGTQNFTLTQKSGILNISSDTVTVGDVLIDGTVYVDGDFSTDSSGTVVDTAQVNGTLTVTGEYIDNADETDVAGTLSAQTATFVNGGLNVSAGGEFLLTGAANFSANTAIINSGTMTVGDNSQLDSTSVADTGIMTVGTGSVFTGVVGCSGTLNALGDVEFFHLINYGEVTSDGNITVTGVFENEQGSLIAQGTGTFEDTVSLTDSGQVDIQGAADFQNTLTLEDGSQLTVGGNITSAADINVTASRLIADGNITTTGTLTTTGNSTLGLSNRLQGSTLGKLEAGTGINLSSTTSIETDLSSLSTINQPTLLVHMIAGTSTNDFMIDGAPTTTAVVGGMFGTSTLLRQVYALDNGSGYDIYGNRQSVEDFAQNEGLEQPAIEAGGAVDDLIDSTSPTDPAYGMVEDLLNQTDPDSITQTLYNLAGGYGVENIFTMTLTNLGQAGSPFFFGNATGISQKENPCYHSRLIGRMNESVESVEVWGAPFYQSIEAGGNFYQSGFNAHETGLMVGMKKHYTPRLSAGLLFAYGAPRLHQGGGLAGYDAQYYSSLDLDDYQVAGHLEYETENKFQFSIFAGGGSQNLKLNRIATGTSSNDVAMDRSFTGKTDGNTLSVTAYLSRPFCFGDRFVFRPCVGVDCMYQWLYSFGEDSTGTGDWMDMTNLSEGNFYSPVQYGKTQYNRIMARMGFRSEYHLAGGGLSAQVFYGSQLGGNDCAVIPVSTLGGAFNNRLYGYGIGRDTLNLGCGVWRYMNTTRTIKASANYNYFTLARADAANVTAALTWQF